MSTLVYQFGPEGEVQAVSPDGQKVAYGTTDLRVVHVPNPTAIWPIGAGRAPRFLDNDHVTWIRPIDLRHSQRFVADLRAFTANPPPTDEDTELLASNDFEASNGHWGSSFIDNAYAVPLRRLAYDNRVLGTNQSGCRMAGRYLLTIRADTVFEVYRDGVLWYACPRPADANEYQISTEGWITCGYYGVSRLITPDGRLHNISVAPWGQEGPARLVHLPDGSVWAWTATNNRIEQPIVLGRPLIQTATGKWFSDPECVELPDFPATSLAVAWWAERASFTVAGSANLGHETPCQVHVVPSSMARAEVPDPAPPGPLPDVPWKSDPVGTPFDISSMLRGSATAEQSGVLWYRKSDPLNGDPVGAWLDFDEAANLVGLLADSSTGQVTGEDRDDWMYFDGIRTWMPLRGASGWSAEYDCDFVWRDGTRTHEHVRVVMESGYARIGGVEVFFRHTYDPRHVDPKNPRRQLPDGTWVGRMAGFLEYSYYDHTREQKWDELQDDHDGVPHVTRSTQPVPFTGKEVFQPAPRPQPYGPIAGDDEMNAPGVTIDSYDPVIRPGQPWKVALHDRNNDVHVTVELRDGSLYASLKNAKGENKSGNKRPVVVQP